MMRGLIVVAILLIIPFAGNAQKIDDKFIEVDTTNQVDLIDVVKDNFKFKTKKVKRNPNKKVYFSIFPTSGNAPGSGKILVTSTNAGFYLGSKRNTNLSEVSFSPYLNFKGRYAISFRNNLYTTRNRFNIQGDTRFSYFPEFVYGTKENNQLNQRLLINYNYVRFYQTILKQIKPYLLAGIGYNMDYHIGIKSADTAITIAKFTNYQYGTGESKNSFSSGLTFNLLYDTRYNSINPLPGAYANLIYRLNPSFLGNGQSWKSLYLDVRKYQTIPGNQRKLLALWTYLWTALDNNVPYLDLPAIGAEPYQRSGRGIEINRYRGKNLFYMEGEYRSDITYNGLLGYVAFTNMNINSNPGDGGLHGPHLAAGAGLRIKFNKRSNTNIAIDYAFSKGNSGIYLNLGEAF